MVIFKFLIKYLLIKECEDGRDVKNFLKEKYVVQDLKDLLKKLYLWNIINN